MLKCRKASNADIEKAYAEWWLALEDGSSDCLKCLWNYLLNDVCVAYMDSDVETIEIPGTMMNKKYKLRGLNKYPEDCSILAINTFQLKLQASRDRKTIMSMKDLGFRWFPDIVDNKLRRENVKK